MEKLLNRFAMILERNLLPIASTMGRQRHLMAMRDGIIAIMPIGMVGAIVVLLNDVVFNSTSLLGELLNGFTFYAKTIQPLWDQTLVPILSQMWWGTLALGIIFMVFTISYTLAKSYDVDPLSAGVIATVAKLTLLPQSAPGGDWGTISWTSFNSEAMFTGLIVTFIATEIYTWVVKKGWIIKMPAQVPPAVSRAFSAIIPAAIVLTFFASFAVLFMNGFDTTVQNFINRAIQQPLMSLGQSPLTLILLVFLQQFLWFFGLHGATIIGPVLDTLYSPTLAANAEAILVYKTEPVNAITRNMIDLYGMHGGSGATLGLIIAIFLFSKRQEYRELSKMALVPGVFQINEPMIFGMPIVLNPILAIPFILVPPITVFIGWFFTAIIPFAGYIYIAPPWVTPPIISAFLATGGSMGATILAGFTLILSILMYAPFIILANKDLNELQK